MKIMWLLSLWTIIRLGLVVKVDATPVIQLDSNEQESSGLSAHSKRPRSLSLAKVQQILTTEVDSGYDNDEDLWFASMEHAWENTLNQFGNIASSEKEDLNDTLRLRRPDQRDLDTTKSTEQEFPPTVPFLVCDLTFGRSGEVCLRTIQEALQTTATIGLYNRDDMTCVLASPHAFTLDALPSELAIIPMTPELKLSPGLLQAIAEKPDEMRRIEAAFCPMAGSDQEKVKQNPQGMADLTMNALLQDPSHRRRSMLHESPRKMYWNRLLDVSDSENGSIDVTCRAWMKLLEMESSPEMILWNIIDPVPHPYCLHTMVVDLTLQNNICSVSVTPEIKSLNLLASEIVQGGSSYLSSSNAKFPFYEAGLNGTNQIISLSDTGLDVDNCYFHDDSQEVSYSAEGLAVNFNHRKVVQYITGSGDDNDVTGGHGTHVAGSIAGFASSMNGEGDGMARAAKLSFYDMSSGLGLVSPVLSTIYNACYNYGKAKIHSISWGSAGTFHPYRISDQLSDVFMYENPDFLIVVAAGNEGDGDLDGSINSPALSKNALSVGASLNTAPHIHGYQHGPDYLADFSSRGPTSDGRRKPDLIAPGQYVRSARAVSYRVAECDNTRESGLMFRAGTSMSAPFVSGSAALVRQYFEEGWHLSGERDMSKSFNPRASLVKAVLINGGTDLLGVDKNEKGMPPSMHLQPYDNNQGFGRINLLSSLPLKGHNEFKAHFINAKRIHTGNEVQYTIIIDNSFGESCSSAPLSVALVWTDPPVGSFCSGSCVLNNLDLSMIEVGNGTVFYPNGLDGPDNMNNVERLRIKPKPDTTYQIKVKGTQLIQGQDFSLVISGCFNTIEATPAPKTKSPTAAPTTNEPSMTPTASPSAAPTDITPNPFLASDSDPCQDYTGAIPLEGGQQKTCKWLFNNMLDYSFFCQFYDVQRFCPMTCGVCDMFEAELNQEDYVTERELDGTVRYEGNAFGVEAKEAIVIQGFDLHLKEKSTNYSVEVFTREEGESVWQLVCQSTVEGRGRHLLTPIPGRDCTAVRLNMGDNLRSFYITLGGSTDLIMTSGGSFANNDLSISSGKAVAHFDGQSYEGYGFDGRIRYRKVLRQTSDCKDAGGSVLVDMGELVGTRSCTWLQDNLDRFEYLCAFGNPAQSCPVTCGTCPE